MKAESSKTNSLSVFLNLNSFYCVWYMFGVFVAVNRLIGSDKLESSWHRSAAIFRYPIHPFVGAHIRGLSYI